MFPQVLFPCENIGRQDDLANFWHFLTWILAFFNPFEFLGLNKVNWFEKRLNSCEKMSKICKITLSADISLSACSRAVFCWAFFMRRLSSRAGAKLYAELFNEKSHDFSLFSTQLTLNRPKNSIGLKKDWIHVRKCQKFANSSCRPMFSQRIKTSVDNAI